MLFSKAKLYVQLSRTEALPTSILEAMSRQLPVVVTEGTSFRSIVEDNSIGFGTDATPYCASRAIINAIDDEKTLQDMGYRARQFAISNYSWESITQKQIQYYRKALNIQ